MKLASVILVLARRAPLAALALTTLSPVALHAQVATGTLTGRVSDAETGKSLQGAIVLIVNTTIRSTTNAEGRYTLPGLPAGTYRLEVDYVGLDPFFQTVTISGNGIQTVDAGLKSTVLQMEAVTVAATARGQALAINQQKTAAGIVNIVSEETFGQMTNGNIGYALQRLPGLSVNESEDGTPNGVNIRGMESKYNSFQIDGNRTPTSSNNRGFATSQLVSDGVSNIEVIKAPTPDRDGDAIGGIINVISRSPFERDGRAMSLTTSAVYYDFDQDLGYDAAFMYSDLFSVGGAERNLGLTFTLSAYDTSRGYDNHDMDYFYLTPAQRPDLGLTEPVYFHSNGTVQTNVRSTKSMGFSGSIDYRLSDRASVYFRPGYSYTDTFGTKPEERIYLVTSGGANNVLNASARTGTGRLTNNERRYQNRISDTFTHLTSLNAGGVIQMDTIKLTYDAYFGDNERNVENTYTYVVRNTGFQVAYDRTNPAQPVYTILNGKSPYDVSSITRGDLTNAPVDYVESVYTGKVDLEKQFSGSEISGSLKGGIKTYISDRTQDSSSFVYVTGSNASGMPYTDILRRADYMSNGTEMTLTPDMNKVVALLKSRPELFVLSAADAFRNQNFNDFETTETTNAAYVMGTVTRGRTSIITGVRAENINLETNVYEFVPAAGSRAASANRISRERDYTVWLPGIHLRHELKENLILRASYNRSYGKPDLDDLIRGRQLNPENDTISDGNTELEPSLANNFDLQLESYTDRGGLYSIGFFYKDIKGFYYDSTATETIIEDGVPTVYRVSKPQNALGAENYGVELIARQSLFFLPKPFDGLSVDVSATFTESDGKYPGRLAEKLPTYGFSDYIFNSSLEYAFGRFKAKLSYTYRAEYLEGLDGNFTLDDIYGASENVDLETSYEVSDKMRVFLNIDNLTERPQISYQGFSFNPEDSTFYTYRATAGVTYRF